ncbi:dehydrogenase, partial [Enterococcus faecium]
MRIAVTGGIGYLGAHPVRALLEAQHSFRLLVLPQEQDAPVITRLRALGDVSIVVGDIRSEATGTELLAGMDAVVHAAG